MPGQSARGFICGRRTFAPLQLVTTVVDLANTEAPGGYVPDDVYGVLVCTLQMHRGPLHHGVALELHGPEAGTVWAVWRDSVEPCLALVIPDCPARSDGDACSEFTGHPGAHSWDLADPPHPLSGFPLPLPATRPPGQPRPSDGRLVLATERFHHSDTNRTHAP